MLRWPRWSAEPFRRLARPLLWSAGAVVGVAAEWRLYGWTGPGGWVPDLLTGWCLIGCGPAGWARRPQSRSGALLVAAGFAWFVPDFATARVGLLGWLGGHALYLHRGPLVQLVLTYPLGRVRGRVEGAPDAYRTDTEHNVYLTAGDPGLPAGDPRRIRVRSAKGGLAYDQIPSGSPLRVAYESDQRRVPPAARRTASRPRASLTAQPSANRP